MGDPLAIRTENLSKTYGRAEKAVLAVDQLNLEVASGQVYGFLGPNGAGKSTTIRMLVGLIRPTAGRAYLYGEDPRASRRGRRRVGAMVETPGFYGFLSGRDNLTVLAQTAGQFDPRRIDEVLEQVGLADHAHRPAADYSTGMKQRLGIAAALLGDPDLVILDEPTNGLDPAGIKEMRGFIRELAQSHGKTVFLSSHILHEVEQGCDRVAIIHRGRLVREGAERELLGAATAQLRLKASPPEQALRLLQGRWSAEADGDWIRISAVPAEAPEITRRLVEAGVEVYQLVARQQSLEEYFMEVTV